MTTNYRASSTVSIGLNGLAHSASLVAGRCSAAISNATNKDDGLVATLLAVAHTVAPTAGGQVELWAFAQRADGTWPELFTAAYTGADGNFSVTSRDVLLAGARLIGSVTNDATASRPYPIQGRDLAMVFGFVPQNFAFFVVQSTGQQLNAAGNVLTIQPASFA